MIFRIAAGRLSVKKCLSVDSLKLSVTTSHLYRLIYYLVYFIVSFIHRLMHARFRLPGRIGTVAGDEET